MARQIGLTPDSPTRFEIGAGKLVQNYGESNARSLGGTRGGATFTITPEYRDVEVDGTLGMTKGLKHIVGVEVTLEATLIEFDEDNLEAALQALTKTSNTPTGWDSFKRVGDLSDSDYQNNVSLLVEVPGKTNPAIYQIRNALQTNPFAVVTENNGESTVSLSFAGHYDLNSPTDEPWRILKPTT